MSTLTVTTPTIGGTTWDSSHSLTPDDFATMLADVTITGIEGATVINETGADVDFRIEGDTATNLVVVDAGLDAFQVGTTTAGALLDLRPTSLVINEASADMDIRIESNAVSSFFNIDGSGLLNGQVSIGAAVPTNPQAMFALLPPANATGVTANQSVHHQTILPGGATTIPTGTAPVVSSLNIAEPNITATGTVTLAATVHIANAPTEGSTNAALYVASGTTNLQGLLQADGGVVFNEASADVDFRVESNALANFFVIDANECLNGCVSIGAAAPTNPQAMFALLPPANATGVTASQSYFHGQILPGGATTIPTGTAPVVASLNIHEPNITATGTVTDAATVRIVDAPTEGTNNHALWVDAGSTRLDGDFIQGGNPGDADTFTRKIIPAKACTDGAATDLVTFTIPNANHSGTGVITIMAQTGGTDAFESTRVARFGFVITRTTGANAAAAASAVALAQIATVAAGDTLTITAAFSAVVGAVGASNTLTLQVTLDSVGNQDCVAKAVVELHNSETAGITVAAA